MFTPKTLIVLWTAFWLLMISVAAQEGLRNPLTRWWEPVLREGSSALVASGWMWLAVRARGRHAPHLHTPLRWLGSYLRWLPLVAVTFIVAVYAIRHGVYAAMDLRYAHPGWRYVFVYETAKLTVFVGLWLGILFGLQSHDQWQLQRHRLLQTQRALAEAQLAHLQGQLRPHFLFNALNTVSSVMHMDVARADRLLAALGDLLRTSLGTVENEMTPLVAELRTLALYADIMRERFRDRVTLTWQIDPSMLDTGVPALLLQPLLENAFKHAVEPTLAHIDITVSARHAGGSLDIVVHNSCSTLPAPEMHDGLGLRNCRERLSIIYGNAACLVVRNEGGGVAAHVSIPLAQATR
jgi:two-component system, LytTR family, sensor kinase